MQLSYFEMNVGHIGGTPNVNLHIKGKNCDIKRVRCSYARAMVALCRCVQVAPSSRPPARPPCPRSHPILCVAPHPGPPPRGRGRARAARNAPRAQAMDWNKSTADNFMKGIVSYVNNVSLRDMHLSPSMAFNPHVHSTKFLVEARAILEEGTVAYVAIKCSRRWGKSLVFPSTATIKELVKEYNIPLEVRVLENALAQGALPCCFGAFSRWWARFS
jgi:hypothetical protein